MFGFSFGRRKAEPQGEVVIARLNARLQPIDRGLCFEDPLGERLKDQAGVEVTGGGTQLDEGGVAFCDIELRLADLGAERLAAVARELEAIGAPKGSKLIYGEDGAELAFGVAEGLGVFLNGVDLPGEVYAECDVNHVIAEANRLLGGRGRFMSCWQGERETGLFFYGPSFAEMRAAVAPLLAAYPLCRGARVAQIA
jgi:hypothetical protein